jgi:sugar/nucleoside kinase (ribokinase family)
MPKFDVICVGNAKIDAFLSIHEANQHLRLNKDTNELCIKSGEKITVDKCDFLLGGNAANVAVGLNRLGLKTLIIAEIGDDEFSQKITKTLQNENIDTSYLKKTKGQPSSFSTIINFKGERTIFSEHVKRKHDFDFDNISTKFVYLTSLGNEWENAYARTVEFVKKSGCKLAFNPGTLQIEEGYKKIADVLSITDILFVNKEEAIKISNIKYQISNIEKLLKNLQNLGPNIVVITDGKNGSYAIDQDLKIYKKDADQSKIVERTGAGDAYSSGFISAILHNLSINDAMRWGAANASSVIERIGAQTGLLIKDEMQKIISKLEFGI